MPLWDDSARQYDAFEKKWYHYEKIAKGLLKELDICDLSNVLELASGTGACSKLLGTISTKGRITGIDSSPEMVRFSRENMRVSGFSNISYFVGDVSELANIFPQIKFDVVVCNSAFWHFPDLSKVSRDVHSLLNPGGQFGFNITQWFTSDDARNIFRKKVREILEGRGLDLPESGTLRNQTRDYHEILDNAGFSEIREVSYEFEATRQMLNEWHEIPAFSDQFRSSKYPQDVIDEIRREFEKVENPSQNLRTSRWKIFTAKKTPK